MPSFWQHVKNFLVYIVDLLELTLAHFEVAERELQLDLVKNEEALAERSVVCGVVFILRSQSPEHASHLADRVLLILLLTGEHVVLVCLRVREIRFVCFLSVLDEKSGHLINDRTDPAAIEVVHRAHFCEGGVAVHEYFEDVVREQISS